MKENKKIDLSRKLNTAEHEVDAYTNRSWYI